MGKPVITNMRVENGCLVSMEVSGCPFWRGKVREILDLGDELLVVVSDRISAFDVGLPTPIPGKGGVLNQMSEFWFGKTTDIVPNGMITTDINQICERIDAGPYRAMLIGRSMLMHKCKPLHIECVVRGYLYGSGWKEYQRSQTVCGIELSPGLVEASMFSEPIFTPSTKAGGGLHDENITFERACEIVGADVADEARGCSLAFYTFARDYAAARGIIIADTKFEFGFDGDRLLLIDEVLTPDSSRFWPADQYVPGRSQPSFDKQYVRDYLEALCAAGKWDKTENNIPILPPKLVAQTSAKYREALRLLTTP